RQRPLRDRLAARVLRDRVVVVDHLERAEAPLAGEDRCNGKLTSALATPQALYVCHGFRSSCLMRSRAPQAGDRFSANSSVRHWHLPSNSVSRFGELVAAASSGLSLGRSG